MREHILLVQVSRPASKEPLIDSLTRKLTAAARKAIAPLKNGADILCFCGKVLPNRRLFLPSGAVTTFHAIHLVAFHRQELPPEEIAKVQRLNCGEMEPNESELLSPQSTRGWG